MTSWAPLLIHAVLAEVSKITKQYDVNRSALYVDEPRTLRFIHLPELSLTDGENPRVGNYSIGEVCERLNLRD